MKKVLKLIGISVGSLFAIFIVLGIIGSIAMDGEVEKVVIEPVIVTEEIIEYEEVSADNVIKLYEDNELKADQLFKNKRGIIVGKASSIERVFGQVYVTLEGSNEWSITQVQCYFDDDKANALINISTGDIVKIEGTIEGKGWNVDVKDCILR